MSPRGRSFLTKQARAYKQKARACLVFIRRLCNSLFGLDIKKTERVPYRL